MNATYFETDWIDIQLLATVRDRITGQELTELVPQNAASATANGIELELTYAATDNLLLNANFGWLDTQYTSTTQPRGHARDRVLRGAGQHVQPRSRAHRQSERWRHARRRGSTRSTRAPTGARRSRRCANAYGVANDYESGDYWRFNAQMAYTPPDARYQITLYGTNLTNEYELNSGFLHNIWQFDFATVDRPREVGVGMRMNF